MQVILLCGVLPIILIFPILKTQDIQQTRSALSAKNLTSCYSKLAQAGVPLKADREQAWKDFAGWRVNYDRVLLVLCSLVMAPQAPWSSDRAPKFKTPPMLVFKKKHRA